MIEEGEDPVHAPGQAIRQAPHIRVLCCAVMEDEALESGIEAVVERVVFLLVKRLLA